MALTAEQLKQATEALNLLAEFLPPAVRPYVADVALDAPLAFDAFVAVKAAVAKFPPRNVRTVASILEAFGIPADSPAYKVALLVDALEKQVEAAQAKPV